MHPKKEYKQLIKDIRKTLKFNEHEIDRDNYAVIKFDFKNSTTTFNQFSINTKLFLN